MNAEMERARRARKRAEMEARNAQRSLMEAVHGLRPELLLKIAESRLPHNRRA